jgi:hypothetical protein
MHVIRYTIHYKPHLVDGLIVLALALFFLVANLLRLDFVESLQHNDGWWYLNRAWLHSHGILDEVSFYTLAYPLLVGAVNLLIGDLPLSAIAINAISQLFLLLGVYVLGKQLVNRAVGLLSAFLLALNVGNLFLSCIIHPSLLFTAVTVWLIVLAIEFIKQPSGRHALGIAILLAGAPFIRTEGVIWGLIIPVALVISYLRGHTWRALLKYALIIALVVSPMWLGYFVWFSIGTDALSRVGGLGIERITRAFDIAGSQLNSSDWAAILVGLLVLPSIWRTVFWLLPILLMIFAYMTFLSPRPEPVYALQLIPYLMIIYSTVLFRASQRSWLRVIVAVALALAAYNAFQALQRLPAPLEFRSHPVAARAQQAVDELTNWRQANGYERTTLYTLCTDLMIFAQFDIRLPYTGLLFSSRRFAPPEQVLPQIAAQDALLLVCPSLAALDLPWTRLYGYWSGAERDNPELADMARYPLEEVGRVREYILYRVKPELQSAQ